MIDAKTRSYLSGLAAKDAVTMHLGKSGAGEGLAAQLDALLEHHELVRLRFTDFKDEKQAIAQDLAACTKSDLVRLIGNTALFFRQNPKPEKRKIDL